MIDPAEVKPGMGKWVLELIGGPLDGGSLVYEDGSLPKKLRLQAIIDSDQDPKQQWLKPVLAGRGGYYLYVRHRPSLKITRYVYRFSGVGK